MVFPRDALFNIVSDDLNERTECIFSKFAENTKQVGNVDLSECRKTPILFSVGVPDRNSNC